MGYRYCAQLKTVIKSSAPAAADGTVRSVVPTIAFRVAATCQAAGNVTGTVVVKVRDLSVMRCPVFHHFDCVGTALELDARTVGIRTRRVVAIGV